MMRTVGCIPSLLGSVALPVQAVDERQEERQKVLRGNARWKRRAKMIFISENTVQK
jgi:hypothetical protein